MAQTTQKNEHLHLDRSLTPVPPLGETTSHSTRLHTTAAKSLVIPEGEGYSSSLRGNYNSGGTLNGNLIQHDR